MNTRSPATRSTPSAMQTWALPTSPPGAWTRPSPVSARRCAWPRVLPARITWIGVALLLKGEAQAALTETQKESEEAWRLIGLTMVYHTLGRKADSDAALAELTKKYAADWAYNIAYVLAWRNEPDRAFEWLDKAVTQQDPGLSEVAIEPLFANLHEDPALAAVPAQDRQGAGATRGDQVRREAAELVEVAHRSFDGRP